MAHQFHGNQLVVASHNKGKLQEIADLLTPFAIKVIAALDLDLPKPAEIGTTFFANATIKAIAAATAVGLPALADDSGLVVTALNGAPGLNSARWAGPEQDFAIAMAKIDAALRNTDDRSASFVCALAMAWPDGYVHIFEGTVHGTIVWPPRGDNGFGYDPIFQPASSVLTFAEMTSEAKCAISHRTDAFRKLVNALLRVQE